MMAPTQLGGRVDLRRRLLLGAALLPPSLPAADFCRVVGSHDPPYRLLRDGPPRGLYIELLVEAARLAGWPLSFEEAPAARALLMLEQGQADLALGALRTPERERFLHYSRVTLPPEDKVVVTRADAATQQGLADLAGLRVGLHRGKRYGADFDAGSAGMQRVELPDYLAALRMLALGRLDAVLLPERQARSLLADPLLADARLRIQPWRLAGETPYLVLSRRSPWLPRLAELEAGFDQLHRHGVWQRLLARYAPA